MIKQLAGIAAALLFAGAAHASTVINDGGSYTLDAPQAAPFFGNVVTTGTAGSFTATFTAQPISQGQVELSITQGFVGLFENLKVSWQSLNGAILSEIDPITAGLSTLQTKLSKARPSQNLVFEWTDSTLQLNNLGNPLGFDFEVNPVAFNAPPPVPLPASLLMLAGGLAGLGAVRARKSAA